MQNSSLTILYQNVWSSLASTSSRQCATVPTQNHIVVTNVRLPYVDGEKSMDCRVPRRSGLHDITCDRGLDSFTAPYEAKGFEAQSVREVV